MSKLKAYRLFWNRLLTFGNILSVWQRYRRGRTTLCYQYRVKAKVYPNLLPYPIDMSPLLAVSLDGMDETGVLCNSLQGTLPAVYDPTSIAQYALVNWNAYLAHGGDEHRAIFMTQANWLLAHKTSLSDGICGWLSFSSNAQGISRPCLSALTQGIAISVLLRAYQLTGRDAFMQAAHQAVRPFELDILDGGVSAPIGDEGVFFEEVAIYPASHVLSAHILALFGLYDYVAFTHDNKIEVLIQQSVDTLHSMLDEFDTGYWTRYDFSHKSLAPWFYHFFHITLLEVLARYSGCEHCAILATRWASYQRHPVCLLRYLVTSRARACYDCILQPGLRRLIFHTNDEYRQNLSGRVCIPIAAFPVAGGMRSVLAGVAQVMGDRWKMVYLTYHKGREAEGLEIETFGRRGASPWRFPFVWLYCLAGWSKLFALLRRSPGYDLILPQDGVYTASFAALIGKMAGVRVVCMDHGNVSLLDNPAFWSERNGCIKAYAWYRRIVARLQVAFHLTSLHLLARIATHCADQFLVAGDEVESIYRKNLGVHPARIIRYAYMVDVDRFTPPDKESRVKMRAEHGIPKEAIIITLINRLAPEKGLHLAIEGIAQALSTLSTDVRMRVKVLIAGDGPLRSQVEADIGRHGLNSVCRLWGEVAPSDVVTLLAISDIFLYSGTRGTNYSMAVLEAMASGCAVIASTRPLSNARLLADGRGIAVPAEHLEQTRQALVLLLNDLELCHKMGQLARNYVAVHHSAAIVRRSLLRASNWSSLDEFLRIESER
jgi:glycosyltransferase involved in cell wall biosynthesis